MVLSKTMGTSQVLEFMGIELDRTRMEARLPEDKLLCTQTLLNSFTGSCSVHLIELHSLIGTLQFAFTLAFFCFLRCSEFTYKGVSRFRPQFDQLADCVSFLSSLV